MALTCFCRLCLWSSIIRQTCKGEGINLAGVQYVLRAVFVLTLN